MDILCKEINGSNDIDTQLGIKEEPQSEFLDNFSIGPKLSVMAADSSSPKIKKNGRVTKGKKAKILSNIVTDMDHFSDANDELQSEAAEIIKTSSKKRRKVQKANHPYAEKVHRKEGKSDITQLPCIINIKSPAVLETTSQKNHNGMCDTSDEMPNTSLQSSISERTCESSDHITLFGTVGQNSSNNTFTSKVYQMLVDIQSTLKDLKAEIGENTKKIDQLQKFLPHPWAWETVKNDFDFPVSTYEQLLELEKQLEDNTTASKLFINLTSRTYSSWREMVLFCLKYMLSRNVAVLYNLNGLKGSKKKFRDLNICNILVACVLHKYNEAATPDILKRISFILAGAGDWQGSRKKMKCKKIA